jgi:hypothetical protein
MLPLPPSGHCDMFSPTLETLRCIPPPSDNCDVCKPTLKMLRCPPQAQDDAMCPSPRQGCCTSNQRAKKVDQHPCPQPEEDAHAALEEAAQLLPLTVVLPFHQSEKLKVFPSLLGSNAVCDGLLVTDDKKDKQFKVFSSSPHILRRFFSSNCLSSLLAPPTPLSYSSTSPPGPCVSASSQCKQCSRMPVSGITVVWRKDRDRVDGGCCKNIS